MISAQASATARFGAPARHAKKLSAPNMTIYASAAIRFSAGSVPRATLLTRRAQKMFAACVPNLTHDALSATRKSALSAQTRSYARYAALDAGASIQNNLLKNSIVNSL